jgi:hypothetical protein
MYGMRVTHETAGFIGKYFNDGIVPPVTDGNTFFIFGTDSPGRVVSFEEFAMKHDFSVVRHSALFYVR